MQEIPPDRARKGKKARVRFATSDTDDDDDDSDTHTHGGVRPFDYLHPETWVAWVGQAQDMTLLLPAICQAAMGDAPGVHDAHYAEYERLRKTLRRALEGVYAESPMLTARGHRTKAYKYMVELVLDTARFGAWRFGAAQGGYAYTAATTIPETIMRGMSAIERQTAIPFRIDSAPRQNGGTSNKKRRNRKGKRANSGQDNKGTTRLLENQRGPLQKNTQRGLQRGIPSLQSSRSSSMGSFRGATEKNGRRADRGGA